MKKTLFVLALLIAATGIHAAANLTTCDMDANGVIDSRDLTMLRQRIGWLVAPFTLGDPSGDGKITIVDVRSCVLRCDKPSCAI